MFNIECRLENNCTLIVFAINNTNCSIPSFLIKFIKNHGVLDYVTYTTFWGQTPDRMLQFAKEYGCSNTNIITYKWNIWKEDYKCKVSNIKTISEYFNVDIEEIRLSLWSFLIEKQLEVDYRKVDKNEPIFELMNKLPKLPKKFDNWIEKKVINSILTYKRNKRETIGYCHSCNKQVELKNAKHKNIIQCPNCKRKVILSSEDSAIQNTRKQFSCNILQKVPDGIVIRHFEIIANYYDLKHGKYNIIKHENARIFCSNSDLHSPFKYYELRRITRNSVYWDNMKDGFFSRNYDLNCPLYTQNLKSVLKETPYKWCGISEFIKKQKSNIVNIPVYFYFYEEYPFIEKFIKLGYIDLVKSIMDTWRSKIENVLNTREKKFNKILKLNKGTIPLVNSLNKKFTFDLDSLNIIQKIEELSLDISIEDVDFLYKNNLIEIFDLPKPNIKLQEIINYLKDQSAKEKKYTCLKILEKWKDYVVLSVKLNYNLRNKNILFPDDLLNKNKELNNLYIKVRDEQANKKILEKYMKIEKLHWQKGNYLITAPKSCGDLIQEGNKLHHCVGGNFYTEKISNNKCCILFLRKIDNPTKPLTTIEIVDGNVLQCKGVCNSTPPIDIINTVDCFVKEQYNLLKSIS